MHASRHNIFIEFIFQETLILQVMQLTEEQIATLPEDQRQSLLQLKEKIINSSSYKENH